MLNRFLPSHIKERAGKKNKIYSLRGGGWGAALPGDHSLAASSFQTYKG